MSATAIAALTPGRRTTACGEVVSVASFEQPWVRTDAESSDGTRALVLRFVGRLSVPGVVTRREVVPDGTPGGLGGTAVMINRRYSFTGDGCSSTTS